MDKEIIDGPNIRLQEKKTQQPTDTTRPQKDSGTEGTRPLKMKVKLQMTTLGE